MEVLVLQANEVATQIEDGGAGTVRLAITVGGRDQVTIHGAPLDLYQLLSRLYDQRLHHQYEANRPPIPEGYFLTRPGDRRSSTPMRSARHSDRA